MKTRKIENSKPENLKALFGYPQKKMTPAWDPKTEFYFKSFRSVTLQCIMMSSSAWSSPSAYHTHHHDHHPSSSITLHHHHSHLSSSIINHHPSSSIIIHHPSSSIIIIHHHPSSSIINHYHLSSSIIIHHHLSSFIVIYQHPSSSIIIQHHLFIIHIWELYEFSASQKNRLWMLPCCQNVRDMKLHSDFAISKLSCRCVGVLIWKFPIVNGHFYERNLYKKGTGLWWRFLMWRWLTAI